MLQKYRWSGNIRQLRNIAEQISVLEQTRSIDAATLRSYLPNVGDNLPAVVNQKKSESDFSNEREILYKVLFDMKSDLNDLKKLTLELMRNGDSDQVRSDNESLIQKIYGNDEEQAQYEEELEEQMEVLQIPEKHESTQHQPTPTVSEDKYSFAEEIEEEETLSLQDKEIELIKTLPAIG